MLKGWRELLSDDDALPMIRGWVSAAPREVRVLPVEPAAGRHTLEALQVSTHSTLGAVAYHTGGILVDHGWLRVLGAGGPALPRSLDGWNDSNGVQRCDLGLLVADDVLGGFFAWFREPCTVHYLPPDTLEWEDSELGYSDWLAWSLSDRLQGFYRNFRWDGWVEELASLGCGVGLSVYPPLFAKGPPIGERSRKAVPVEELWGLASTIGPQLRDVPDDGQVRLTVKG
jgi:hypothetical protein